MISKYYGWTDSDIFSLSFSRFSSIVKKLHKEEYWDKLEKMRNIAGESENLEKTLKKLDLNKMLNEVLRDFKRSTKKEREEEIQREKKRIEKKKEIAEKTADRIRKFDRG